MTKKQNTVMWNHLQYIDQVRALDKIGELLDEQTDETMRTALAAAIMELEIWSNTPLDVVNSLILEEVVEDEDEEKVPKTWIH